MPKPKREKISLYEFLQRFPNEEAAEKFFENERWGETGHYCPHCGSLRTVERANRKPLPYRCKDCRKDSGIRREYLCTSKKMNMHKNLNS